MNQNKEEADGLLFKHINSWLSKLSTARGLGDPLRFKACTFFVH